MDPRPLQGIKVAFVARQMVLRRGGDVPLSYCRALRDLGARVEVVLFGGGDMGTKDVIAAGFETHVLDVPKHSWRGKTSRAMTDLLIQIDPDFVHASCYDAAIHASRAVTAGVPARLVITHHDSRKRLVRRLRAWPYRRVPARVISTSKSAARWHQRWYGYAPERCVALTNPVPEQFFNPPPRDESLATQLGLAGAYPVAIWPARLVACKGHADLLRAWREVLRELPAGRLLIVGDGKLHAKLSRLAQRLGVSDTVILTGFRPDVLSLMALSHILVCPSLSETLCMAALEAMAAGLAVVSTRVWGPADHIQDGVNGLLVPIGAWRELAAGIVRLAEDREFAQRLAEAGRAYAREHFTFEAFRAGLARIYLDALAES